MTFTARFGGQDCGYCDEPIKPGQEVEYDGSNRLVHAVCPEVQEMTAAPTCPTCNLELPLTGVCDDCG
jgi:hypothetical protein